VNAPLRVRPGPSSWPRVPLGELAEHRLGKMLDKAKNTGVPRRYLRNPNVRWFDVDLSDLQEILVEEKDVHKYELRPGDVLICEGGEAGRAALWKGEEEGVIFQKACHRVRVGPRLDARFLIHRLMYDYFSGGLEDYYTGATIKHFTGQDLARYEFPLPPLDQQQRIAAILDKADELRRKRKRALALLDSLTQAIFLEMFGDPAINAGDYRLRTFGEISEKISDGPFGSNLKSVHYVDAGVRVVRLQNIGAGKFVDDDRVFISEEHFRSLFKARMPSWRCSRRDPRRSKFARVPSTAMALCGH
jgi:type I restriction enzyme S subunit